MNSLCDINDICMKMPGISKNSVLLNQNLRTTVKGNTNQSYTNFNLKFLN